jgi:hypothetical protein
VLPVDDPLVEVAGIDAPEAAVNEIVNGADVPLMEEMIPV